MEDLKMNYLKVVKDNYSNFNGRARRKEYWYFVLANFIILALLSMLGRVSSFLMILSSIYSLAVLIPSLAVGVRRLHDINKSGWFMLLALIPLVNLYLLYLMFQEGDKGANQYGPDPKAADNKTPFATDGPF